MAEQSGEIYLTKMAAARRQLCEAIDMFFAQRDELAVHTVASAAYRIISDLKAKRGRDEAADRYCTDIFYLVREYRRGNLPKRIRENQEVMRWIEEIGESLPITTISKIEDVSFSIHPKLARDFWQKRNIASNFLKHADRDAKSYMALKDLDNLDLLVQASGAYLELTGDNLWPEGFVLWVYWNAARKRWDEMPSEFQKLAAGLEELADDQKLKLCSDWLGDIRNVAAAD